jgi:hypothetical protein
MLLALYRRRVLRLRPSILGPEFELALKLRGRHRAGAIRLVGTLDLVRTRIRVDLGERC